MSEAKPTNVASPTGSSAGSSRIEDQVRSLRLPRTQPQSSKTSWLAWMIAVAAIGASGWLFVQWQAARQALIDLGAAIPSTAPAANVNGSKGASGSRTAPTAGVGSVALESRGYVVPAHQILISPQVNGRLVKLNIEEGRRVSKGDLLAEIDRTEYAADHARCAAQLALAQQRLLELERGNRPEEIEQARAELEEFIAQLSQLEIDYGRNAQLVKGNLIPPLEFELSESKYRAMQRRVERTRYALKLMEDGPREERIESARAEVDQAKAELTKAQWRLDNCRIVSPIAGTILKKNAEEGNIVNPIAFNGSFSICELADLADLEVALDIQERDIAQVFAGQKCRIRAAEAYPDRVYDGYVARLMPIADRSKGSIQVRVRLSIPAAEEGVYLKPEMGAKVTFLSPESAATPGPAGNAVTPDATPAQLPGATTGSDSQPVDKTPRESDNAAELSDQPSAAGEAAPARTSPQEP